MKPFGAFLVREWRVTIASRTSIGFGLVFLFAGFLPLAWRENLAAAQAPLYLLQVGLYLFPLLGILLGTGSSHADAVETELLLAQPYRRFSRVAGKFGALLAVSGLMALLLFLPSFFGSASPFRLAQLLFGSLCVLGGFIALGMAIGFVVRDGVQAHMVSLAAWVFLLAGGDLIALVLASLSWIELHPEIWVSWLMLNPLDALRVGSLFGIEAIPFDLESIPVIARWWLSHPFFWLGSVSFAWTSLSLGASSRASARFSP